MGQAVLGPGDDDKRSAGLPIRGGAWERQEPPRHLTARRQRDTLQYGSQSVWWGAAAAATAAAAVAMLQHLGLLVPPKKRRQRGFHHRQFPQLQKLVAGTVHYW